MFHKFLVKLWVYKKSPGVVHIMSDTISSHCAYGQKIDEVKLMTNTFSL